MVYVGITQGLVWDGPRIRTEKNSKAGRRLVGSDLVLFVWSRRLD